MKKVLLTVALVACSIQASFACMITVVPYCIEPSSQKVMVLLGRKVSARELSPRARSTFGGDFCAGVWVLPQARRIFMWDDPVEFACQMFNKKTLYSFARAIIDNYPSSPHASRRDPFAGYSCFIPDDQETVVSHARLEAQRECSEGGAYAEFVVASREGEAACGESSESCEAVSFGVGGGSSSEPAVVTSFKNEFDREIAGVMKEQWQQTPTLQINGNC